MQRKWPIIVLLFFVFEFAGCGKNIMGGNQIISIELECADICKRMNPPPFSTMTLNQVQQLNAFEHAIGKAKKMRGSLDYGVMFFMYLSFDDNTQKKYVLNVDDEEGRTALLVDTSGNKQGYIIPEEQTNELREIIYSP